MRRDLMTIQKNLNGVMDNYQTIRASMTCISLTELQYCPYCGSEQKESKFAGHYLPCHCCEAQKHMEKLQQLQELRDQSNLLKKEIENYKRRSRELWEETDVGGRYYNARLENFDPKGYEDQFEQIVKYAKKFDQTKGKGLILLGSPGTGKTYLAAAVGHHVVEHFGMSVWFKSWPELLQQIKNSYNGGGLTQDVIDCLLGVDLLVIDDFGKGQTTEWAQEQLYTVVNGRYRDMKPVIITTNYNLPTLREIINPAVISRLDQMCMKIRMVGPDYRLKKEAV